MPLLWTFPSVYPRLIPPCNLNKEFKTDWNVGVPCHSHRFIIRERRCCVRKTRPLPSPLILAPVNHFVSCLFPNRPISSSLFGFRLKNFLFQVIECLKLEQFADKIGDHLVHSKRKLNMIRLPGSQALTLRARHKQKLPHSDVMKRTQKCKWIARRHFVRIKLNFTMQIFSMHM